MAVSWFHSIYFDLWIALRLYLLLFEKYVATQRPIPDDPHIIGIVGFEVSVAATIVETKLITRKTKAGKKNDCAKIHTIT